MRLVTEWQAFARDDLSLAAEMLGRIVDKTADHWLVVEPQVIDQQRSLLRRKPASSPYSIVISPYADDDEPHMLIYLTFPKGARFSERGWEAAPLVQLDDEGRDDASLRVPLTMPVAEAIRLAMSALDSTSDTPLGDQWRARIEDTYVPRPGY
jgi:hypothetical protein